MEISFIHTQILVRLHVNKTNFHDECLGRATNNNNNNNNQIVGNRGFIPADLLEQHTHAAHFT